MSSRADRGLAALEFALVTPLMLGLVLGAVEYGARYAQAGQYNNAALIAARKVAINNDEATARSTAGSAAKLTTAQSSCSGGNGVCFTYTKGNTIKCGVDSSDGSYGDVTVTVTTNGLAAVTPLPNLIPGVASTYGVSGKAVFRCGG